MPKLVGGDVAADLLQYRLLGRIHQGRVVGAGTGLDDTAGNQLAGARAADRGAGVDRNLVTVGEALETGVEVEIRVGELRPFRKRPAMLDLFVGPLARDALEFRIVMEDVAEILGIVAAIVL